MQKVVTLDKTYAKDTVITVLSWAETLGLLQLGSKKYYNANKEEDEEDQNDYPSLDDEESILSDTSRFEPADFRYKGAYHVSS